MKATNWLKWSKAPWYWQTPTFPHEMYDYDGISRFLADRDSFVDPNAEKGAFFQFEFQLYYLPGCNYWMLPLKTQRVCCGPRHPYGHWESFQKKGATKVVQKATKEAAESWKNLQWRGGGKRVWQDSTNTTKRQPKATSSKVLTQNKEPSQDAISK